MVFNQSKLVENIFSMVSLRVLGPEKMGAIVFSQSVMVYLVLISSYGFNLTAPRALASSDSSDYAHIFSLYMYGSIFLGVVSTIVLILGGILYQYFGHDLDLPLYIATYTAVIGNIIFPIWFFQGIQEMRYITILNLIGRFICLFGIFILVKGPNDYVLAALFQSCTPCIAGIISLIILTRRFTSLWTIPSFGSLLKIYKEGWLIFLSTITINLYTTTSIIILGTLTNHTVVGYYSAADKLLGCRMVSAVNDAVYPHVNILLKKSYTQGIIFLKKQLYIYILFGFCGGLILLLWGDKILLPLLGESYYDSIILFKIMSFIPMIVAMSNVLGYETMLSLHMESIYSKILISAAIVSLIIIWPLTYYYGGIGTAITTVITELFVTISMGYVIYRNKIYSIK